MKIEPLNDHVVVRPDEAEQKTAGGVVLPESAQEKPRRGRVIAVGDGRRSDDGRRRLPPQVSEGDRVLFAPYAGTTVQVNGEELLIFSEREILAVLE